MALTSSSSESSTASTGSRRKAKARKMTGRARARIRLPVEPSEAVKEAAINNTVAKKVAGEQRRKIRKRVPRAEYAPVAEDPVAPPPVPVMPTVYLHHPVGRRPLAGNIVASMTSCITPNGVSTAPVSHEVDDDAPSINSLVEDNFDILNMGIDLHL